MLLLKFDRATESNTVTIHLTAADMTLCTRLAELRNYGKEKCHNRRLSDQSDFGRDFTGATAECAVGGWLGVNMDERYSLAGDDGSDLVVKGIRIQVKNNLVPYPAKMLELYTPVRTGFRADLYVLTRPYKVAAIEVLGWIPAGEYEKRARVDTWRGQTQSNHCLKMGDLYNARDLPRFLE